MKLCELFEFSGKGLSKKANFRKELKAFINEPDMDCYECTYPSGVIKQIFNADSAAPNAQSKYVQVSNTKFPLKFTYCGMPDSCGTSIDLSIEATAEISDVRLFLHDFALERLKTANTFDTSEVEMIYASKSKELVSDEICKETYDFFARQNGFPARTWEHTLSRYSQFTWMSLLTVNFVRYESAEAERAEEIKKRERQQALEEQERQQVKDAELRLYEEKQQYEIAKKQIENNAVIDEVQREFQLEELERQRQVKQLEFEEIQTQHQIRIARMRAEAEVDIAQIKHDTAQAELIMLQAEEAQKSYQETLNAISQAQQELRDLGNVLKSSLEEAAKAGVDNLRENSQRISSNVAGLSASTMELVNDTAGVQYFARILKEKAGMDSSPILMRKLEMRTRDIATRKVDAIKVNDSLMFEFIANRDGYATILNIGTSGAVWLQSPNSYIPPDQACVVNNESYLIPGSSLLSHEDLSRNGLCYIEGGPAGWEELVVIISDQPLVNKRLLFRSTPEMPFVKLSGQDYESFIDQLDSLSEQSWSVGVLSFLVEY